MLILSCYPCWRIHISKEVSRNHFILYSYRHTASVCFFCVSNMSYYLSSALLRFSTGQTVHSAVGISKSSPAAAFMQYLGRGMALFVVTRSIPEVRHIQVVAGTMHSFADWSYRTTYWYSPSCYKCHTL